MAITTEIKISSQVATARLVVLVPDQVENLAYFAHQVYIQALAQQQEVLYLALQRHGTDDLPAARMLSTLSALTQGGDVRIGATQVRADHWADALRQVAHPGDTILCPDEQFLTSNESRSCCDLEAELNINVHSLPGIYAVRAERPSWMRTAACWVSGILILIGFSFLEFHLAGVISGSLKKIVLIALIALELGIFYQWDRLFS
jgi:hypothetical protein